MVYFGFSTKVTCAFSLQEIIDSFKLRKTRIISTIRKVSRIQGTIVNLVWPSLHMHYLHSAHFKAKIKRGVKSVPPPLPCIREQQQQQILVYMVVVLYRDVFKFGLFHFIRSSFLDDSFRSFFFQSFGKKLISFVWNLFCIWHFFFSLISKRSFF